MAESIANGLVEFEQLLQATHALVDADCPWSFSWGGYNANTAPHHAGDAYLASKVAKGAIHLSDTAAERARQVGILREIVNPFHIPSHATSWPSSIIGLAMALSNGEFCVFALHDALLDASHVELAEHFRDPNEWHPKGCWALDLILGKS